MADPVDLVREACTLLARYLPQLERLIAEPSAEGSAPGMTPRGADAPLPGNPQAFNALMTPHEGAPRLEAALKYAITGYPGLRRGGSAGNVAAALDAIPKLAAGLGKDGQAAAVRILDRWINEARAIPAIDEAQQWRPLRSRPCPHCRCYFLKVLLDGNGRPSGHIECFTVGCRDINGQRCVAAMGTDDRGRPVLAWADGLTETAPELDG